MNDTVKREYEELRKRAIDVEATFRNMVDDKASQSARVIRDEFTELIVDIRQIKNPRTIEQRVERIQHQLAALRNTGQQVMRTDEIVTLHDHCERFRRDLRKLSNY